MLFDALINLFKTICLAAIAFSPLLVYKALDQPAEQSYIVNVPGESNDLNSGSSSNGKYEDAIFSNNGAKQNSSMPFGSSSPFGGSFSPPPPPPPPVDAPIDSGVYFLLAFGVAYGFYKYGFSFKKFIAKKTGLKLNLDQLRFGLILKRVLCYRF